MWPPHTLQKSSEDERKIAKMFKRLSERKLFGTSLVGCILIFFKNDSARRTAVDYQLGTM